MNGIELAAFTLGALAAIAALYGAYLLATVGGESDPRGRVGIGLLAGGVLVSGLGFLGWHRSR